MRKNQESNLYQLKAVAFGRMNPKNVVGFFWGTTIFSFIIVAFTYNSIGAEYAHPSWSKIAAINLLVFFWTNFIRFIV
ncbi:hypothetical protein [Aquibacillus kalidii]|uniref:hypothetical protein n=1 Tax=Aquibacillus kalidii TaxID=2762597 RepID=UPI001647F0C0|nr:hypothetical protein [Aquibacillus kalidii]